MYFLGAYIALRFFYLCLSPKLKCWLFFVIILLK